MFLCGAAGTVPQMESVLAHRSSLWVFHAVVAVAAGCLLWAFSVPGISVLLAAGAVLVLGLATLLWAAGVEAFRLRGTRSSWWFLVTPAMGVMVVALLYAGLPLQARWALSRDAFEAVVDDLPEAPVGTEWTRLTVPGRLGAFRITAAYRVPGGAVFYEANGSLFDDAGFAYLPGGPNPSLENGSFESPAFKHLGGGWYSWTASW
jgi:hypothetical protein